jgi:hypothetical protein
MKLTKIGSDYIVVDEKNFADSSLQNIPRVHLIKLNFKNPTRELVTRVLQLFPKTNRFVIDSNVREYNIILRRTTKKYYVMNRKDVDILTFLRKNNKILFNFLNLTTYQQGVFLYFFDDLLRNTEVIAITKEMFDEKMELLDKWNGNVIIANNSGEL